jgi:hypothetical protein
MFYKTLIAFLLITSISIFATSDQNLSGKILGIWTSGTSENADFEITKKGIYYVDQNEEYKYSLDGNLISIYYPDYKYKAKVFFQSDTLIMDSKEFGKSKFWRFKE